MDIISIKPLLAVSVSLVSSMLILVFRRHKNIRESWTILASFIKFLIVASMIPAILRGDTIVYTVISILPEIPFKFRVDAFGLFFGLLASFLWILTSFYSIGYMRSLKEHSQTRYFACFAVALSATMGIAFAANLLTLFVFYEILTISVYPLVIHKETPEARSAGIKYLVYTLSGGVVLLFAIIISYSFAGTLTFSDHGFLAGCASREILQMLFILFIIGFGVKSAIMPLHSWLPTAMIAPTPVSALLHAVAVVKAGVFGVVRVIYFVFGVDLVSELGLGIPLAYFVSFTIILASMFALVQDNLKRRLAYSTISQLSYIILGASLLTPHGLIGGILHIVNHAFMKITLFFCAGAIYVVTRKENISEMNGIGRRMPITMLMFFIAVLGMCGFPPVCGFISKWYLLLGSVEADQLPIVVILLTSSLLNVAYFFPIVFVAFFKKPEKESESKEAPIFILLPLTLTAIISLILGIWPDAPYSFFQIANIVFQNVTGGVI
ncbi:MAG: monovalent cation/H+ antiporter subunit D family protein [Candidatus Altiarchaeales archaeon]|nr:MAG: monovalent cation/H+ antiporter subunit D family protein [Candidatus Altiarchaeales archaeon]